ncbi:hypothetical protein PARPLA_02930 [Rhodobacteraceae bacterium THAF1]|uniref:hypothetical protein n=1 Tax=Palleronia sp. THAF1 TaxID=2587842 RepID=UPI000F40FCEE|nr:hypothetical protein [Palleronia sp. THAF1]QFU08331.1 hypothetical protein FIU81_06560 [Palleronia sp. THAF1]VDC28982.1 hypothetical protein PARPLA_02930 [Rhodobacteraceae bacterium THAF1]
MRPVLWLPVLLVCVLAAVYGLRLRAPDMGEAIERVARLHADRVPGAKASDCAATPGDGNAWLVVACGDAVRTVYRLDRSGRVIARQAMDGPGAGL